MVNKQMVDSSSLEIDMNRNRLGGALGETNRHTGSNPDRR
jgi:hypothetical protein